MARDIPHTTAIRWDGLSAKAWESQLSRASFVPYQQARAFGEVIRQYGGDVLRAEITAQGETIGLCQIAIRKLPGFKLATALLGPVWLDRITAEQKIDALDRLGRELPLKGLHAFLLVPPDEEADTLHSLRLRRVVSAYHTVLLDLTRDDDALMTALDGKWRNRLRAGQKAGLTISTVGRRPEQYQWLLEAERQQRQQIGYQALSPRMVPAWQEAAGKDSLFGLEAKAGADRIAGMLFFRHGTSATYHIGWSSGEGRERNAMNVLLWKAIIQLKKKGVRTLDLGGVDTDHAPGLARFKLGTGGKVLSQSGTWLLRPRLR